MALVIRVVPCTNRLTWPGCSPTAAIASSIAVTGASGRDGTFAVRLSRVPQCTATMSVKVPPISVPTSQTG